MSNGPEQMRLDAAWAQSQRFGYFASGPAFDVAQHENIALLGFKPAQLLPYPCPPFSGERLSFTRRNRPCRNLVEFDILAAALPPSRPLPITARINRHSNEPRFPHRRGFLGAQALECAQ